jgi:16S rRNA (guanine966-N2)-methyltransferase
VRVIGGRFKGRRLEGPSGAGVRPTSDRLRETLFNLVDVETPGRRVLDVCAGTGALGIEALSRGAAHVTFIDRDRRATALIARNLARVGASDACIIVCGEAAGLSARRDLGGPFHLVLLDPPYDAPDILDILTAVSAVVRPGGLVVLEHSRRVNAPDSAGRLHRRRVVTAGDSCLCFYALADD